MIRNQNDPHHKLIEEHKRRLRGEISHIRSSINSGVMTVSSNGRTTTFQSINEMQRVLEGLIKELNYLNGIQPSRSFGTVMRFKGSYD